MKPSKLRRLESRRAARESYELAVVLHSLREGRTRLSEAGQLGEAITPERAPASTTEGPRFRVVLISEGLGNRLNLNYYGREAIESAPAIFEGKPCFLNHPAVSEERDIPERRVQDKCGYFKNCQVVESEGRKALEAELHFDLSATGRMAADKARTALHYRSEFPGSAEEYVGLSVNADGLTEVRNMLVDGVLSEVN